MKAQELGGPRRGGQFGGGARTQAAGSRNGPERSPHSTDRGPAGPDQPGAADPDREPGSGAGGSTGRPLAAAGLAASAGRVVRRPDDGQSAAGDGPAGRRGGVARRRGRRSRRHRQSAVRRWPNVRQMWLNLDLRLEDAQRVALGQQVRFWPDGGREAGGRITWISTEADHKTRTVKVRAVVGERRRPPAGQRVRRRQGDSSRREADGRRAQRGRAMGGMLPRRVRARQGLS